MYRGTRRQAKKLINEKNIELLKKSINNIEKDDKYELHREYCITILTLVETKDLNKISSKLATYLQGIFHLDTNSSTFNNNCLSIDNYDDFEENILSGKDDEILLANAKVLPAVEELLVDLKDETSRFIAEHYKQHQPKSARK